MNRRRFLGTLLGAGASTLVLPSMVWPFRKIFLPSAATRIDILDLRYWAGTSIYRPNMAQIEAVELESFAREIPDLIFNRISLYEMIKRGTVPINTRPFHIPFEIEQEEPRV